MQFLSRIFLLVDFVDLSVRTFLMRDVQQSPLHTYLTYLSYEIAVTHCPVI